MSIRWMGDTTGRTGRNELVRYKVGDTIEYSSGSFTRIVKVLSKEQDIKNGFPGFTGHLISQTPESFQPRWLKGVEEDAWGYDTQVTRVVEHG